MIFINHDDLRSLECFNICLNDGLYVSDDINDLKYSDIIYLGRKGLDRKNLLYLHKENIYIEELVFENLLNNTVILTLIFNKYMYELSLKYNFTYIALLDDESFINENSVLTAEGMISYMISHRTFPLYHSHILILGYGHCAKAILKLLNGFDSCIDVYCRNKSMFEKENGHVFNNLDEIDFYKYNIIVNTIPEVIIDKKYIDKMNKDVAIFDIASFPYGIDHHYALEKGLNAIILPSIPTRYAYKYAGRMIYNRIKELISC